MPTVNSAGRHVPILSYRGDRTPRGALRSTSGNHAREQPSDSGASGAKGGDRRSQRSS